MRRYDYSFLENGMVPAGIVNVTSQIYVLRERVNAGRAVYGTAYAALEPSARVRSVKSSNAIEGIEAGDKRIAGIVNQGGVPLNRDEADIAGYAQALDAVSRGYGLLDFSRGDILGLHGIMLSKSGADYAGAYKTDDNLIIEIDSGGRRSVRFRPVPASETEAAMEQLELAYKEARCSAYINQLLLIPCVILDFLCIHPFRDGNGRLSRLLSLLLLYKNDFDAGKYISFEEQIYNYRDLYYEALKESSAGWDVNENDYFPFVQNFLLMLQICYNGLDERFTVVDGKRMTKKARVEAAVQESLRPLSKSDICRIYPDISPTTVEAVLGSLVRDGKVIKLGNAKNTKYIRNFNV